MKPSVEVLDHEADKLAQTLLDTERAIERALHHLGMVVGSKHVEEARHILQRLLERTKDPRS